MYTYCRFSNRIICKTSIRFYIKKWACMWRLKAVFCFFSRNGRWATPTERVLWITCAVWSTTWATSCGELETLRIISKVRRRRYTPLIGKVVRSISTSAASSTFVRQSKFMRKKSVIWLPSIVAHFSLFLCPIAQRRTNNQISFAFLWYLFVFIYL